MTDTNMYVDAVVELQDIKLQKKEIEEKEEFLTASIKSGIAAGLIDEDQIRLLGLNPRTRSGGYDDGVCVVLKDKGFRDAVTVKEVADQKTVKELEASGQLTADDLDPYRKKDSWWLELPRGKKAE